MRPFLAIGSVTVDRLKDGDRLGGSALYAALCAKNLGYHPKIITTAPPSVLEEIRDRWDVEAVSKETPVATTFEHVYEGDAGERTSHCRARAPMMDLEWLKNHLIDAVPTVVCPNVHNLSCTVLDRISSEQILLLPQGWFRRILETKVTHAGPPCAVDEIRGRVSWVVASRQDLSGDFLSGQAWCRSIGRYTVVTDGPRSMELFHRTDAKVMSPVRPAIDVDPTGAGDVFSTTAFLAWCEGLSFGPAVSVGSLAASIKVERSGMEGIPTRSALLSMARETLDPSTLEQTKNFLKETR